jgi:xanthine/uracil permease
MLIGFNLAPVVATFYWPADQWVALATMLFVIVVAVGVRGFIGRIAVFIGLIFGYLLSWLLDATSGPLETGNRINWAPVETARWFGFPAHTTINPVTGVEVPGWHLPDLRFTFILLVLPAVIALVAENAGHVKAVAEMTRTDLDPVMGRAIAADGVATVVTSSVGGSPTTTYAENIGVMAATRIYSTAAYYVAAVVAILFGFSPKFGAVVSATPNAVLGGITVVLYGMIGLLGAKIWKENRVDFGNPINLVPISAGIIIAIGNVSLTFTESFSLGGIALGTLVTIVGYHLARWIAPPHLREQQATEGPEPRSAETTPVPDQRGSADAAAGTSV